MKEKKFTVKELLIKHRLYNEYIKKVNYHMGIDYSDPVSLVFKVLGLNGLTEEELVRVIYELILKCDSTKPEYDYEIDEKMIRFGLRTDKFYGGNGSNQVFSDETSSSLYDDFIDSGYSSKF